jgi:ribosome-interacting GTPase 1
MWQYEDVQIQLVDTPPMVADQPLGSLLSLTRSADVICVVVDAADNPLEQADTILGLLSEGRLDLRSVPRRELDEAETGHHSGIIAANKADAAPPENISALRKLYAGKLEVLPVSAATGEGLEDLCRRLWELLSVMRVYTKKRGRAPDHDKPFTLEVGSTVADLAREIHRELPEKMKYARIWGKGRFAGQQVHQNEALHDKDVVEIHE